MLTKKQCTFCEARPFTPDVALLMEHFQLAVKALELQLPSDKICGTTVTGPKRRRVEKMRAAIPFEPRKRPTFRQACQEGMPTGPGVKSLVWSLEGLPGGILAQV
eukprot:symbB.v1.2.022274.t1/scaffold1968.1/size94324/7